MSHHTLLEYIRKAKDCGASDTEISDRLHTAGWYRVDIQDAFELYRKVVTPTDRDCETAQPPAPNIAERLVPRSYDPHIIAVAALSFAIGFVGYILLR
jgi:hypothetical protein